METSAWERPHLTFADAGEAVEVAEEGRTLGWRSPVMEPPPPGAEFRTPTPWRAYAVGLMFGFAAVAFRLILRPFLGDEFPLLPFFVAVTASAWLAGFGPALATLGMTLAAAPWLSAVSGALVRLDGRLFLGLGLYAAAGGGVAYLGGRIRRSLFASEEALRGALARHASLQTEEERLLREQVTLRETAEAQAGRLETLLREVQQKNAFLTAILRQVPSGIVVAESESSKLLLSNDEADRIIRGRFQPGLQIEGYSEQKELVGLRPDGSRYDRDEWPLIRSLRTGEVVVDEEIDLIFGDGLRRKISVNSGPALDDQGRLVAAAAVFDDVTERRNAETEVAESERRFRELAEALPQIVFVTRPDHSILYINKGWFEYTGVQWDPAKGESDPSKYVHPDDVDRVFAQRAESRDRGGPLEMEYRLLGRDGRYRWFLGRSIWVRDAAGELVCRFGSATDIDDRRRTDRANRFLADAGARLAALTDAETTLREIARLAVPFFADWCAVDVVDETGGLKRVAMAHDMGAEHDEVVQTISYRYRLRPDMPGGLFQVIETRRPTLLADVTEENMLAGAWNDEHLEALRAFSPRSYLCVPLVGRDGVLGALSFATTSSGRHYDQIDLDLAVELAARAAIALENGRLYDRLREHDRRKDDFLATLAHELRNPMAPIRNGVSILRMKGSVDADSQWAHGVIDRQLSHLVRLVDDLLDVSRLTRDKLTLRLERIDLASTLGAAVETSRPVLDEKGQELRIDLPTEPILLDADPTRLSQVISNLLNNAAKFSERGARIELTAACVDDQLEICVSDPGCGIPGEQLPHIFEMFAQFTPILERRQGGLGIGLALVKGIVELHGGSVEAHSEGLHAGSKFLVRLPLPEGVTCRAKGGADADSCSQNEDSTRARVLVVDDCEDIAESLGRILTLQGYEVHLAYDGERALLMAGALRPDFAVLDIGLPGMNGYDLAAAIRSEPWGGGITLIAVTGWGQHDDRKRSSQAGFDHHLVKPVEPDQLVQLIVSGRSPHGHETS